MDLSQRLALVIQENNLKQRELASMIGVTEGYISSILTGRKKNPSQTFFNMIEEKLGYNVLWLTTGTGEKLKTSSKTPNLSDEQKRAILQLEKMPDEQVRAVMAFMDSLEKVEEELKKT